MEDYIRGIEFHDIIENIFGDVQGLHYSSQVQVNCPKCQERDGLSVPDDKYNLEINTDKRIFRCWKCDFPKFSGSLGRLIKMYGTTADYELYKSYAGIYNNFDYYDENVENKIVTLPEEMILFENIDYNNPSHFDAYSYLITERKLTRDIILKFKMGFCVDGKYAKRIIIPSYNAEGELNYFVSRAYNDNKKRYDNPKSDKDLIIFNESNIDWDSTVYLVEGVFDMLSIPINTIPMLGKTISSKLYLKIKDKKPYLVILLDPDAIKEAVELFNLLKILYVGCEDRIRIVEIPTKEDIDEYRINKGDLAVIDLLYTARYLTIDDYFIKQLTN